ncbi:MAG: helix-hairpin-helix domain-containing protein [Nitrosomonas sp.]|jgi:competence protein ComEA|uniref:ComEA family DNA-binding protein n=1 Tax=Nitrosomonas sp. TaxID=42353 RepID=UPI001DB68B50|nr:helix-hairpin-helix domain-containing protein [Nitrosomonas sp.]MBX9893612.1 helix-hairpin-helix domain-containing protein [Nitrosomonas sp.]
MKQLFIFVTLLFLFTGTAFAAVNLNTATQAELESLQGIGPAKAKAIVEYREKNGAFTSVDDLAKVAGVGPGIIKQIRDAVTVTVATEQSAEAPEKK